MRTYHYSVKGSKFTVFRDRFCNQGAWSSRAFAWWVFYGQSTLPIDYMGNFQTLRAAEDFMASEDAQNW